MKRGGAAEGVHRDYLQNLAMAAAFESHREQAASLASVEHQTSTKGSASMQRNLLISTAMAALLGATGLAHAQAQQQPLQQQPPQQQPVEQQQAQQPVAGQQQQQIAQQCLEDLRAEAQQMEQEGLWLTGWGSRWGTATTPSPVGLPATQGGTRGTAEAPRAGESGMTGGAPWPGSGTGSFGVSSPRYQIRTLYSAAHVLAYRGDEQGCQTVLEEVRAAYDDYANRLRQAGVEPGEITSWRQERIAAAEPVQQVQQRRIVTIDDITGTDVRNLQDEHLGSVDDVVVDPQTGEVSYLIVARGGFLGIGEDSVAIPWEQFRATAGLNLLVLDMREDALEQAPEIDPERFSDPESFAQTRQQTDEYWEQQRRG